MNGHRKWVAALCERLAFKYHVACGNGEFSFNANVLFNGYAELFGQGNIGNVDLIR